MKDRPQAGFFVFLHREHVQGCKATRKLASIVDGPSEATSMSAKTVPVKTGICIERVLHDRVITSPVSDTGTPYLLSGTELRHGLHGSPPAPA